MNAPTVTRGRPLLVLASILGAWLVGRVLFWNPLFPHAIVSPVGTPHPDKPTRGAFAIEAAESAGARPVREPVSPVMSDRALSFDFVGRPPSATGAAVAAHSLVRLTASTSQPDYSPARRAAGHQMLLAAAFGQGNLPDLVPQAASGVEGLTANEATSRATLGVDHPLLGSSSVSDGAQTLRLSGDSWLLWRDGSDVPPIPGGSTYGRSQAGAVLRYRMLPGHALVPEVYARATRTLEGSRQSEVAAGLSFRPLVRVPVTLAAEARFTEADSGREIRPAVFAVTQFPPVALPLGLRGEAYVQGGYVGGRFATPFVDGQARVDGQLVSIGDEDELRLGLAGWGGAQEGAARLDVGPSLSIAFKIGGTHARVAADYRMRIAGGAEPADGPALTFSAGF